MEGVWPSSPHLNVSPNLFSDPINNNGVSAKSSMAIYPNVPSKSSDVPTCDRGEDGKKTEKNSLDCWLFGVNLSNKCCGNVISPSERELRGPISSNVGSGPKESIPAAACETERVQSLNYSLSNKGQKQIISEASPNEWQNKQATVPSMRTRTKVHCQPCVN